MKITSRFFWREYGLSLTRLIFEEGDSLEIAATIDENDDSPYIAILLSGMLHGVNPNRTPTLMVHTTTGIPIGNGKGSPGISLLIAMERTEYMCLGPIPIPYYSEIAAGVTTKHLFLNKDDVITVTNPIIVMSGFVTVGDKPYGQGSLINRTGKDVVTCIADSHLALISTKQ